MFLVVCEVIVRHKDGTFLLMQRDTVKHMGGRWELSAGGAAQQGETPLEAARRELREETGIVSDSWEELGRVVHYRRHVFFVEFLCRTDCPKDSVTLQPGETMAYRWVTRAELQKMPQEELATLRRFMFLEGLER